MDTAASPVYAFLKRPSMVDYAGRLAVVFFTGGCNFQCRFCHNADLMTFKPHGLTWEKLRSACERYRQEWVDAAVISGGEPTEHRNLPDLIACFRRVGWAVKLDTNGSHPDVLRQCLPHLDYVAMDVKAALEHYPRLTGYSQTDNIVASIRLIMDGATDYEFRTTVIDSFHTDEQMVGIADMIRGARRYVIQPFLPKDNLPDASLRAARRTPRERLEHVRQLVAGACREVSVRGE